MVFSDLSSARLSTQKNRLVTLSGELLEVSGAITGGSKLNKDLAYRFGINNEIDLLIKTKSRLNNEQLRLEKDLSRFESRKEALNESRGSYALRILLEAGLELSLIHI